MATEKILEWAGAAKRDLMDFPENVRRAVGYALGVAQLGAKHPSAKPWKGVHQRLMAARQHYEAHYGHQI